MKVRWPPQRRLDQPLAEPPSGLDISNVQFVGVCAAHGVVGLPLVRAIARQVVCIPARAEKPNACVIGALRPICPVGNCLNAVERGHRIDLPAKFADPLLRAYNAIDAAFWRIRIPTSGLRGIAIPSFSPIVVDFTEAIALIKIPYRSRFWSLAFLDACRADAKYVRPTVGLRWEREIEVSYDCKPQRATSYEWWGFDDVQ